VAWSAGKNAGDAVTDLVFQGSVHGHAELLLQCVSPCYEHVDCAVDARGNGSYSHGPQEVCMELSQVL
jgi:hypothetical protein